MNKIKIFGLVLLFSFIAVSAYSQKCKYDYQRKDPLTGEETKGNTFGVNLWWKLGLNKNGDNYFVGMFIRLSGNVRDVITPENTIIFKLENGEIITIYASEEFVPTAQATQNGVISVFNARFNISENDLQKIASSPLTYIKMSVGPRVYEETFASKKGKTFQEKARCILQ
jgi:hypothetical protein